MARAGRSFGWGHWFTAHPAAPVSAQEPQVSSLHPSFGPQGGGTLLSLGGTNISAGSSWEVTINGSKCPLAQQPRYVPAITPGHRGVPGTRMGMRPPTRPRCPLQPLALCPQPG